MSTNKPIFWFSGSLDILYSPLKYAENNIKFFRKKKNKKKQKHETYLDVHNFLSRSLGHSISHSIKVV